MNFELELKRAERSLEQDNYKQCANTCRIILEAGLRLIFSELMLKLKPAEISEVFTKYRGLQNPFTRPGIGTIIGFYSDTGLLEKHTPALRKFDFNRANEIGKAGSHAQDVVNKRDAMRLLLITEDFLVETGFKTRREFNNEEIFALLVEMATSIEPLPHELNSFLKTKAVELGINREVEERLFSQAVDFDVKSSVTKEMHYQYEVSSEYSRKSFKDRSASNQPSKLVFSSGSKDEKTLQLMQYLHQENRLPMHYSEIRASYEQMYQEEPGDINGRLADGANPNYGYASTGKVVYSRPRRGFYSLSL